MHHIYPILHRKVQPNLYMGSLIGYSLELMADNLERLHKKFITQIIKMSKTASIEPVIYDAHIHIEKIQLHLVYPNIDPNHSIKLKKNKKHRSSQKNRSPQKHASFKQGNYLMEYTTPLHILILYGVNEQGEKICLLPEFKHSFHYQSKERASVLIQAMIKEELSHYSPEDIYKLIMKPMAEISMLKVNHKKIKSNLDHLELIWSLPSQGSKIHAWAEQFPPTSKSYLTRQHYAWECQHWVQKGIDLIQKERSHILLVGDAGVGKTTILKEIAIRIHQMSGLHFFYTTPQRIMAGTKYLGDWQLRCEDIINSLTSSMDYLWMGELSQLPQVGSHNVDASMAAIFYPAMRDQQVMMIGEMQPHEYQNFKLKMPRLANLFSVIEIPEMNRAQVQKLLKLFQENIQRQRSIEFEADALEMSFILLERFYKHQKFPGKAVQFLRKSVDYAYQKQQKTCTQRMIIDDFIQYSGLAEMIIRDDLPIDEVAMQNYFESKIIGQSQALSYIYNVIKLFKVGLNDPKKPIANLLFVGPTGVGKTACANTLAHYFFGQGQSSLPLVRFDMSEFQHSIHLERLIGSAHETGQLIKAIRGKSFCVILLDEIEKAHPIFFDVLLSILDEGILYDAKGNVTYFYNTIIIMTSNLGVDHKKGMGLIQSQSNPFLDGVKAFFRPEFFNRIDAVLPFQSLDAESMLKISRKELQDLSQREGIKRKKLKLDYSDTLVEAMATLGFNPIYGARPLQRCIDQHVTTPLSFLLAENPDIKEQVITLDWKQEQLSIHYKS